MLVGKCLLNALTVESSSEHVSFLIQYDKVSFLYNWNQVLTDDGALPPYSQKENPFILGMIILQ